MKAIVSLKTSDGYAEVGMNERTVVQGKTVGTLRAQARRFAQGRPFRLEIFSNHSLYGKPTKVEYE